ncbi:unnamed protein product [Rhizoctonia solani]|uniref:NAD(P)-binding domain-containing protein n=1 Tax=Rhizoctonia solani TaxID=456999 RepID=A0A8H3BBJ4_9AGAM|nr:unnamed protein product [Rhizoctonia solani]
MESDPSMSEYVRNGLAKLVRGDALVREDVQKAWDAASSDGQVDLIFSGIGGDPSFSITQGFIVTPADITTRSMSILLSVVQASPVRPRLVAITSNGLDHRSHSLLPLALRIFYGWFLRQPHEDKIGLESNIKQATSSEGWLDPKNAVIVRPALLTSGKCVADTKPNAYRVGEELGSAWTVSRADVGHFVVEKVLEDWNKWAGKAWVIAY